MWFGTQDGLNRFDGYKFKIYRHEPKNPASLRKSHILSLYEDRLGNLWVGTSNGALSLYDRAKDQFIHFKESEGNYAGISQRSVTTIYEDKQDNFWVGTFWKLNLLDRKTGKSRVFGHDPADSSSISNDAITSILEDSRNNLWVGTSHGLNLFDRTSNRFTRFIHDDNNQVSISNNYINVIKEDERGGLWIGTNDGLNLMDTRTGKFVHYRNQPGNISSIGSNRITDIEIAGDGNLWLGTEYSLELFDPAKNHFSHFTHIANEPNSLARNGNVMSMLADRQGILWVGTYQGGINKFDKSLSIFDTYRNNPHDQQSLSFNTVTGFAETPEGDIWVSTGGGALNLWQRQADRFLRYNPDPERKDWLSTWGLLCLYQSKKSRYLYIGTYGSGMDRYDPHSNTFTHFIKGNGAKQLNNDAAYAIFEDRKGNIWIGTNGGGVNVLNTATGIITKYMNDANNPKTISGNFVRSFYEDAAGNMWVGTTSGLNVFDLARQVTRYDQNSMAMESDIISALHGDSHGNIWMGTVGGGLNRLNLRTQQLTVYTTNEGLPDNTINSIIEEDNGILWLSTNNGISRFDVKTGTFRNSSLPNGIQSFEFSQGAGLKTSKGEILFGGVNGFNFFDPAKLVTNKNLPPVVITNLKLYNQSVSGGDKSVVLNQGIGEKNEIILSYDQSVIRIDFAALGFTATEKNQYSFMLEGFDKNWHTGSQRTATYTNLDPGEYTFKVKGSNNDGRWNERPTTIKLIITPPFWKTWWFRTLMVLSVVGCIYVVYKIRIRSINAHKILLEKQVIERTESLAAMTENERRARKEADQANIELAQKNQELEQFAYVASHDLQEPLRTTTSFIDLFQRQYHGKIDEKANTYLTYILQANDRMRVLIKDLLDYSRIGNKRNLQKVDCNIILREVLVDIGEAVKEAGAAIENCPLPIINGYPTEIKGLFQNLVLNAIKFQKAGIAPQLRICVQANPKQWEFSFTDNGIGIDEQYNDKIFVIFQRLHSRAEYKGSGIGLSHCKKIVELHNGQIWFKSAPGEGSTFYFTIPKLLNCLAEKG